MQPLPHAHADEREIAMGIGTVVSRTFEFEGLGTGRLPPR